MKKLAFLFVLLSLTFVFVGCADVPDFPNNQQIKQTLEDKNNFVVKSPIYFSEGDHSNLLSYFYPKFRYINKFGDEESFEFNYVCKGYYKHRPDSLVTIFLKQLRRKDDPNSGTNLNLLKIVFEM